MASIKPQIARVSDNIGFLKAVTKYSRFVRISKWFLAAIISVIAVAMLVIPTLRSKEERVSIAFASIEARDGEAAPTMTNPKLQGVDAQKQPFMVTAKTARQLDANTVLLEGMQADMTLKGERWLTVFAQQGLLKLNEEILTLTGKVELFQDDGYEMKTEKVVVHLKDSTAENDTVVEGQGPLGRIKAERFSVFDRGSRIVFNGNVTMTVYPGANNE